MRERARIHSLLWLGPVVVFAVLLCFQNPAHAQALPGPYQQSCTGTIWGSDGSLLALCTDYFGNTSATLLPDARNCSKEGEPGYRGIIWNVDGTLRCALGSRPQPGGRDEFDILSIVSDQKDKDGTTKVWRIDHPDVVDPSSTYPLIPLKSGDQVFVTAGGCVQTGGRGSTWKSYVRPEGDNPGVFQNPPQVFYTGLLNIAGVTPSSNDQPEPILFVLAQEPPNGWTIPKGPGIAAAPVLQLGYLDDGYGDNGYYSHDNGDNNQCLNVGPAWVQVSVHTPAKGSVDTSQLTHTQPGTYFDLAWKIDGGVDANWLPLNPVWSAPKPLPNFQPECVSGGNLGLNLPTCTSQDVTLDVNSGIDTLVQPAGYCSPGPPHGHVNWTIATYTGQIHWRAYSGNWPQDHDDNFGLVTPGQAGETLLAENDNGVQQPGIGVEFNQEETLDTFGSPLWKAFDADDDANKSLQIDGKTAVVTALVGVDGVHGGYSELHPVFAMAISGGLDTTIGNNQAQENWIYFVRNQGTEGSCSSQVHEWPSADGMYYLQLPRPAGTTNDPPQFVLSYAWAENSKDYYVDSVQADDKWVYVKVHLPPGSQSGIDGQFALQYTLKSGSSAAAPRNAPAKPRDGHWKPDPEETMFGADWNGLASRISDSAKREQFLSDIKQAFESNMTPRAKHSVALTFDKHVTRYMPPKGSPPHPVYMRDRQQPNPERERQLAAVKLVLQKYSDDLKLPPSH